MTNEDLKDYFDSEAGKELKAYLLKEAKQLESVYNVPERANAEDQALEFKSQKKALWLIDNILGRIMVLENPKSEGEEQYHVGIDN